MRIKIELLTNFEYAVIPLDYRRGFVSLFKEAFGLASPALFELMYGKATTKPFCFSVKLPDPLYCRRYVEMHGKKIIVTASSYPPNAILPLVQGLTMVKDYCLFGLNLTVDSITILPGKMVSTAKFYTLEPLVVRNGGNNYVCPGNRGYFSALIGSVHRQARSFGLAAGEIDIDADLRMVKIRHYEHAVRAAVGSFTLHASQDIKDMVYCSGIGSRRSQGFGLLSI